MSALLVSVVVSAALAGQAETPAVAADAADEAAQRQAIEEAIERLGDTSFGVREQASRFLWRQGRRAEAPLEAAAKSRDREVRTRAERILNDFRYGIFPGVSADVAMLIRRFRDGAAVERTAAFGRLLEKRRFDVLERLIKLERDPAVRRALLTQLFSDEHAVIQFIELKHVRTLIEAVGADQNASWRSETLAQVLFAPAMLERIIETRQLDGVLEFVRGEKSPVVREQMLTAMFRTQGSVAALAQRDELDFLFTVVRGEADEGVRSRLLMQLLAAPGAAEAVLAQGRLSDVMEFVKQQAEASVYNQVVMLLFASSRRVTTLLDELGLDGAVELARGSEQAADRGRLLATLMVSSSTRKELIAQGRQDLVVQLARDETDPVARHAYLDHLLRYSYVIYALGGDTLKALWEVIKSDDDHDWRAGAIATILTTPRTDQLFRDQAEIQFVLELLDDPRHADHRNRLLTVLINNYAVQKLLIEAGYFDRLFTLVLAEEEAFRGPLLVRLCASSVAAGRLKAAGKVNVLIAVAESYENDAARRAYLTGLFQNHLAMSMLIENGNFQDLFELVGNEQDAVNRAVLRGEFVRTEIVVRQMQALGDLPRLLEFAQQEDNHDARREYLSRLFRYQYALEALIDAGHFEVFLRLANSEPDAARRAGLLADFYLAQKTIDTLIAQNKTDVLLEFAGEVAAQTVGRRFRQRLCSNRTAVARLITADRFDVLIKLTGLEPDAMQRVSLLTSLLDAREVVQHLSAGSRWEEILQMVRAETNQDARLRLLSYLTGRAEVAGALADQGHLEALLALLRELPPGQRETHLSKLLLTPQVLRRLAKDQQLSVVLAVADACQDDAVRYSYLQRLFYNQYALTMLVDHGFLDDLLRGLVRETNGGLRVMMFGRLFAIPNAVERLANRNQLTLLLDIVNQEQDADTKTNLLVQLIRSATAVTALEKQGHFDELFALCDGESDAARRRNLLTELLVAPTALRHLVASGRAGELLETALQQPDQAGLTSFLNRLLTQTEAIAVLQQHGLLDGVGRAVDERMSAVDRTTLFTRLLSSRGGVQWLATSGRSDALMIAIAAEANRGRQGFYLRNVVYNTVTLRALLEAGHFDALVHHIEREPIAGMRNSLMGSFLFAATTLDYLAQRQHLDWIFARVEQSGDDELRRRCAQTFVYQQRAHQYLGQGDVAQRLLELLKQQPQNEHSGYVQRLATTPGVRSVMIAAGKVDVLREIVELEPDAKLRNQRLHEILFSPSGLAPYYISRGQYEQAERLLEQQADHDAGRLKLVTYLRARDRLDERIAALEAQLDRQPAQADLRLLVYLLRGSGRLAEARAVAERIQDAGLRKALAIEQRDWQQAAALQAAGPCELPVAVSGAANVTPAGREIEQLGLLAAYHQLAGQTVEFERTVERLNQLSTAQLSDRTLAWYGAQALLINEQVEAGLAVLRRTHVRRAFDLLCFRHQYDEALQLVGWRGDAPPGQDWFHALPALGGSDEQRALNRFELALRVTYILHMLGKTDDVERLVGWLEKHVAAMPVAENTSHPAALQHWELLSQALLRMGRADAAFDVGARSISDRVFPPPLLSRLYGSRSVEATAWWQFFRQTAPGDATAESLRRVHQVLFPPAEEADDRFPALAALAERAAGEIVDARRPSYLHGLGVTCRRRGASEIAARCFEQIADRVPDAALALADLLADRRQWLAAARQYEQLWERDHEQLAALYLAGHCFRQAGRHEEGRGRQQQASEMALDSRARHALALGLDARGLKEDAAVQWQILLQTAPPEHWELNDAARRLGIASTSDPAAAARLWQHYLLSDLRTNFYFLETESYLRVPALVHRLRAMAAAGRGDYEITAREIARTLGLAPADTRVAEDLVPLLAAAGQNELADDLFQRVADVYRKGCQEYAGSALLHNNLAWVAARCGRDLDDALEHARTAVRLAPGKGGYVDTLAEVHFQLGDREEAVRQGRRAVALDPDNDNLRQQLKRFQHDPLP